MTDVNLTITGRVEALRLEPGDTIVVTFEHRIPLSEVEEIAKTFRLTFPDNKVVIMADSAELSVLESATSDRAATLQPG